MRELLINKNDANQRLNKYLLKYLNQAPASFVYKMLRKKNITLNDGKANGDEILKTDDRVKIYFSEETMAKFRSIDEDSEGISAKTKDKADNLVILYRDDDILAVHKAAGTLSQKADRSDYSINEAICDYYNRNIKKTEISDTFKPSVCNRLDRNTSGIILAGISLAGSRYLSEIIRDREIDKYYYTIVKGNVPERLEVEGYIKKDTENNKSTVISIDDYTRLSREIQKKYSHIKNIFYCVSNHNDYSLLKIKLVTGKSHQIRAQLCALGFYMLGDEKYGDRAVNAYMRKKYGLKHHLLHAGAVCLKGMDGSKIEIKDKLPGIFYKICEGEGIKYGNLEFQRT